MQEVTGSSSVSPTIKNNGLRKFTRNPFFFGAHMTPKNRPTFQVEGGAFLQD